MSRPAWDRLDPRAKAAAGILVTAGLVAATPTASALAAPALLAVAASAMESGRFAALVRTALLLWGLTLLANALLVPGPRLGPGILGPLRPSEPGLELGALQGGRLAGLAAVGAWLAATVSPLGLVSGLEWSVRRSARLRRRVHALLFPLLLALRLVPVLVEEARRLREVDHLRRGPRRGLDRLRALGALAPAWMGTIAERADRLSLAVALRGYRVDRDRGFAREYRFRGGDWGLVAVSLAAAGLLLVR